MIESWSPADAEAALRSVGYVADAAIATTVVLGARLGKPILAEGPAGIGKTELAKALADASGRPLFRLQCYEGLDESKVLYEWKYAKQLLYAQLLRDRLNAITQGATDLETAIVRLGAHEDAFFSDRFLEPRSLLSALRSPSPSVLLIDEIDRAEDELEALLLEILGERQVTIPELGTIRAVHPPFVVLTSNASRELSDALRRRCLYLPMGVPDRDRELTIIEARVPGIGRRLAAEVTAFVARVRDLDLKKSPSIAETLDWAQALVVLGAETLDPALVRDTLGALLKYRGDLEVAGHDVEGLLAGRSEPQTA